MFTQNHHGIMKSIVSKTHQIMAVNMTAEVSLSNVSSELEKKNDSLCAPKRWKSQRNTIAKPLLFSVDKPKKLYVDDKKSPVV